MKKLYRLLVVTALALATLAACRGRNNDEGERFLIPPGHPLNMLEDAMTRFPQYEDNGLPHVPGTIFRRGIAEPSPWAGAIGGGGLFSMSAVDGIVTDLLNGGLFNMNEFEQFGEGGIATAAYDIDARTLTFTQHYDVFWHDGVPLTLYDLWFTYHVMAHPEHRGPRHFRSGQTSDITGIWEYNESWQRYLDPDDTEYTTRTVTTISGLELSNNNKTLTIRFDDFPPTVLYFGVWTAPIPAHLFGKYYPNNVAEMIDSPYVRENPVGFGPFVFVHSEPGESYLLRRNENYVWGAPHIEYMEIRRIAPELVADAMVAGEFDSVGFRALDFPYHMNPTNWRYFGTPNRVGQGHFAFRMGWWCFDTNQNVSEMINFETGEYRVHEMMRPEAVHIRRAMAKAIDWLNITQVRYHGLSFPAGAYIPIRHRPFMDLTVPMFPHSIEDANQILDDAGFTNRDAEGYRTWLDGSRMELIWAMAESDTAEWYYQAHTQAWRDIGIRVSLWQGMFHSIWTIWDAMDFDDDDDEVHFWSGAWNHGASPSNDMWSRQEFENASRHNSEELDEILGRINSMEAWDMDLLMKAMSDLQWYMYENVFYFPTTWGLGLTAVNNRVANWDTRSTMQFTREYGWHTIRLTAAEPAR
jgi:peptide/nickel transport system substrate-binding protein